MTQSRWINQTETKTNCNNARYGSSRFVTFYNKKWCFLYTVRQFLINWALLRSYFIRRRREEVAVIEKFK